MWFVVTVSVLIIVGLLAHFAYRREQTSWMKVPDEDYSELAKTSNVEEQRKVARRRAPAWDKE